MFDQLEPIVYMGIELSVHKRAISVQKIGPSILLNSSPSSLYYQFSVGLGSRTSAACKPQGNQPFTILKSDQNMAMPFFKKKSKRVQSWGLGAAAEPRFYVLIVSIFCAPFVVNIKSLHLIFYGNFCSYFSLCG